jgi:TRAP-type mannitol/chloroaromatic compound transport system permease large subunit
VLGFFLDFVEISVIVLPLVAPSLILMGHDPIWLGILLAINLQTSFLTPPFGFLAVLPARRRAARDQDRADLQRCHSLHRLCRPLGVMLVWALPFLATWLPAALF